MTADIPTESASACGSPFRLFTWNFGGGKNYPYFFLNWGSPAGAFGFCRELPFMGVVWWLAVLVVFLSAAGLMLIRTAKAVRNRKVK